MIVLTNGTREWSALVETKVGNAQIVPQQVERYRTIAKDNKVDCVITISNQFASLPENHPSEDIRKSKSRIPVFHWSWMFILTQADLLLTNDLLDDPEQHLLLKELKRFLLHESAGVKGFEVPLDL
ncbi:MAG: hypothetical protein P8P66_07430 [Paracoccaceae bacterium]|jgi:hypothetical protein|nr:hypothetical protein [Paracoccaceae bacterium]